MSLADWQILKVYADAAYKDTRQDVTQIHITRCSCVDVTRVMCSTDCSGGMMFDRAIGWR